jgi:hypothetical protein
MTELPLGLGRKIVIYTLALFGIESTQDLSLNLSTGGGSHSYILKSLLSVFIIKEYKLN